MRSGTEGVDDEDVEVAEFLHAGGGDEVAIGAVGEVSDAEAEDFESAVDHADGDPLPAEEVEGEIGVDDGGEEFGAEE